MKSSELQLLFTLWLQKKLYSVARRWLVFWAQLFHDLIDDLHKSSVLVVLVLLRFPYWIKEASSKRDAM